MAEPCKVFVGNLSYTASEDDLGKLFEECGQIEDVVIIYDRETGRSRGFGFVTFKNAEAAKLARSNIHETDFMGRPVTVKEAESKREGGGGGGGGGGGRYRNGGGGGGYGGGGYGSGGGGGGYGGGNYRGGRDYNDRY